MNEDATGSRCACDPTGQELKTLLNRRIEEGDLSTRTFGEIVEEELGEVHTAGKL
ncbi:MAG: hypothetical protein FWD68_03960 [Alphaproteobacteria bacterium]|nr:hypothetical protein [Alphaproteobacteria bacterium]